MAAPSLSPPMAQFQARLGWIPREILGAEQLPSPMRVIGGELPTPARAPSPGQHTDEILHALLGLDEDSIAELRAKGAVG